MNPVRDNPPSFVADALPSAGISNGVNPVVLQLKKMLFEAVKIDPADGLLFSGGLDSSILASINPGVKAITVSLKSGGEDISYSDVAAGFLHLEHFHRSIDIDEAIEAIPETIKILKTFDPAIPNDIVVYFGLRQAGKMGIGGVMTGDGSDELFAGYSFMQKIDNLEGYIERMAGRMTFSSNAIGNFLGIKIIQPFLNKAFIDFSLGISAELKLKEQNGRLRGKWILRRAFENMLPGKIAWQDKRPLEYGSGMTKIREIISSRVCDKEFAEAKEEIKFINKEHFYYYKIYRDVVGEIPKPRAGERKCPACGAGLPSCGTGMNISAFHCKVCGTVLTTYHRVGDTVGNK